MNRLKHAAIRYLLQHQSDPVDWWKGSEEAFAQAHISDRLLLLQVGFAALHWCHVVAHEIFENQLSPR